MCTDLDLPEIRAWARAELPEYTDGELDRVLREWSSEPRTRSELFWLERALAKSSASAVTMRPVPADHARDPQESSR